MEDVDEVDVDLLVLDDFDETDSWEERDEDSGEGDRDLDDD